VIYFALIALGVGLMVASVARQLRGPERRAAGGPLPTRAALRVCLSDLELLFRELNERAWALGARIEEHEPFAAWSEWSQAWERQVADLSDRCQLDVHDSRQPGFPERTEMAAARDAMRALHRTYGTYVNRFAGEHADLVRAASEALAHARSAVLRGR
jgi:hypothetical protein